MLWWGPPSARRVAVGGVAVALVAAREAVERLDAHLSTWIDRASDALHGWPPIPPHASAWRGAASTRLLQVARIAADLSRGADEPIVESAVERVFALVGQIEEQLDVICREAARTPSAADRGRRADNRGRP